jgi:predicted metal-dependent enzyme (double-stranded beta helix superfamily)
MSSAYSLPQYISDLRLIAAATDDEDEIFTRLGPLAQKLVADAGWLQAKHYESDEAQGFGVHLLHEEPDHSLAVFAVNWLPGRGTPPHDHGTWAVVAGIEGVERNVRYRRVDDGSRAGHAQLEVKKEFDAAPGEVVCIRSGGIHKVTNETDALTLSLHTYGRHVNHTNRAQFDLATNEYREFKLTVE